MPVAPVADRRHLPGPALDHELHGDVREGDRHHLVERVGVTRAQVVGQLRPDGLDAGPARDLRGQELADARLVPVAVGVGLADLPELHPLRESALRGDHEGVAAGVVAAVLDEDVDEALEVEAVLRDHAPRGGDVGRVQGGEARIAPEDPEDADPLVRSERRPLAIDGVLGPRDGGREADAVLRLANVVVHRLGDGDDLDPRVGEDLRVREGVVAADRDQGVDPQPFEVLEHDGREVVDALARLERGQAFVRHDRRELVGPHPFRIGAARVEVRAAGPVDGPGVQAVKRADVLEVRLGARPHVGESLPAAAQAGHLEAELAGAIDHALDDGVEAGNVAASGEDADFGAVATCSRSSLGGPCCRWDGPAERSHGSRAGARPRGAVRPEVGAASPARPSATVVHAAGLVLVGGDPVRASEVQGMHGRLRVGEELLDHLDRDRPPQEALDRAQEVDLVGAGQADRDPAGAGAGGAADPVDVVLGLRRELEVDDHRELLDVEAARGDVRGDEDLDLARLEVGEGPDPLGLGPV